MGTQAMITNEFRFFFRVAFFEMRLLRLRLCEHLINYSYLGDSCLVRRIDENGRIIVDIGYSYNYRNITLSSRRSNRTRDLLTKSKGDKRSTDKERERKDKKKR